MPWLGSGQATATIVGNTLTVQQTSEQALLNWASFNVSADGRVIFRQPDGNAVALNQILQANPSQIFGVIQSNGQIYLINQNGFVFGPTSQVNVGGLLASTLQLSPQAASGGLLSAVNSLAPALGTVPAAGTPIAPGQIQVQPGAQISTVADGERILLAAQNVTNGGTISAPNGQVVLAAGQAVFLQASDDPGLRGLIVEVDSATTGSATTGSTTTGGGTAQNQLGALISVAQGNATLVGLAVNQQGRISATTSTTENGSIRLVARDTVAVQTNQEGVLQLNPSRGGTLTLGPGSQTDVLPNTSSTPVIASALTNVSTVTLAGESVELTDGSSVVAPGGNVSITASVNPSAPNSTLAPDPAAHLRIDSGATIDVSGSTAEVPVTRNLVSVQLRGTELADSPLQRNGPLRGQTVIVDARVGTPLANVSADITAATERGILELTSAGGSITLDSAGDVVVGSGATLNVSGGAVNYTPGIMQTSLLSMPDGATVDISLASPNQVYTGVINPTFKSVSNQWGVIQFIPTPGIAHYDPGYTQGISAGSIQVEGSSLVLAGNFLGHEVNGIYQRSGTGVASGGTFTVGLTPVQVSELAGSSNQIDYRAPAILLVEKPSTIIVDPDASLPSDLPLELPTSIITQGGFTHLHLTSNDQISVPYGPPIDFAPGGSLNMLAPQIGIDASIRIPAGTIQATAAPNQNTVIGSSGLGISVANNVVLDVSGMWVNDSLVPINLTPTGLALVNAGSVQLDQTMPQATLSLGSGVQLIADGGALQPRPGSLSPGTGGAIALVGAPGGTVQVGNGDLIAGFGVQGAAGGSFTLEVPRLSISSGNTTWLRAQSVDSDPMSSAFFQVDSSLFSDFGFAAFKLTADGPLQVMGSSTDVLRVTPGASIDLQTRTLLLGTSASKVPSGTPITGFATDTLQPLFERTGAQLTLQAVPAIIANSDIGDLTVGAGATFTGDPGARFTFRSVGNLDFEGIINSPSGTVALQNINDPAGLAPLFEPTVTLGPSAAINVAGTVVYQPNDFGQLNGQVLPGGSVSLTAAQGSIVTELGSMINFSGTQGALDLSGSGASGAPQRQVVASAAGSLSFAAPNSISMLGSYLGEPGVGTTGRAAGGSLSIDLVAVSPAQNALDIITVQPGAPTSVLDPTGGNALLGIAPLAESGVDDLTLEAGRAVQFINGADLTLARSLTLTAPAIQVASQGPITVNAPYMALGTGNTTGLSPASAAPGSGAIVFNGDAIDLIGSLSFQGVGQATLKSSGEILLLGNLSNSGCITNCTSNVGALAIAGELTLSAARVVATTDADFTITASGGANNTVQFVQNGSLANPPLAAAGTLTVNADTIIQGGTVYAPFGQITFNAADNLTFAPGSLTSVSGTATVIPYGQVQNGTSWIYEISPNQIVPTAVTQLPYRQVVLSGVKVALESGATVDVSGGGNLDGYSFTPGTGGTVDVLANSYTPSYYAVLPSLRGQSAPYDAMLWDGFAPPNTSVYLSGGGGLAAGTYPLLPARYALLPGAFLVSVAAGYQDLQPGISAQAGNGYPIVSGRFTFGNTGIGATRTSGFLIEPGSYAMTLADYADNYASTFFVPMATDTGLPPPTPLSGALPADAGTLILAVQSALDVLGKVNGAAASGGQDATVEIAAPQLIIDPSVYSGAKIAGQVHLASAVLDAADPGRLWLGAQSAADGSVTVVANSVEVTRGASLSATEVLLAGTNSVEVDAGASVLSSSASTGSRPAAATAVPSPFTLSDNSTGAALLIASDLNYWVPDRSGAAVQSATLVLAPGAQVSSRGALTLDAPGGGTLSDGTLSGSGAQWSIGANQLTFGPQGPVVMGGFALDGSLIAALTHAGTVRLASADAIEIAQAVNLGGAGSSIGEIDLVSPGLIDGANAAASFGADLITLTGSANALAPPLVGSGTLALTAREIDIDAGNFGLSGFGATTLDASNVLVGNGSGSFSAAGNVSILSPLLTAASEAQTQVTAGGNLVLAPSERASTGTPTALQSGGSLAFAGQSVADSTLISMPSGEVSISAAQQLTIGNGAGIEVAGVVPVNAPHGSDGGTISLSAGGALTAASGSRMNVAAGAGADAGFISIVAQGAADIGSQWDGSAASGQRSGSFTLQAGSIVNFARLNTALEQSGFHQTRSIEARTGDLSLDEGSSVTALNVALTADAGSVTIAGSIDASSASGGGAIDLSAADAVSLLASARLTANGASAAPNGMGGAAGGQIELASTTGAVQIDPNATVAAEGPGGSGSLLVRAPQIGNDVNILGLPADLTHVGLVVLEPSVAATLGPTPTAADFSAIEANLASYMSAARPAILARLFGSTPPSNVVVRPYADITTADTSPAGILALPSVDFSTWRFAGQPADISIRAGGTLTVAGTVSDGFAINPSTSAIDVIGGDSASISLVAGADFTSASATSVSGASADLALAPSAIVRTGTGELELSAARDILIGQGASVYTGGTAIANADPTVVDTGVPVSFVTGGGGIAINAVRNLVGAAVTEAVDQWNPRFQPLGAGPAVWGIDFQEFNWNVGALAGGNVAIHAGQNITNLTAAVADSRGLSVLDETTLLPSSGGNLTLSAGGDVDSGLFYVANGTGRINAGGSLGSSALTSQGDALGTLLLAGDASYYVSAQRDILLEGIVSASALAPGFNSDYIIFFRDDPNSTLALQSRGGSISYQSDPSRLLTFLAPIGTNETDPQVFESPTPVLDFAAFGGDLSLYTFMQGLPSATGQLTLYASRDILSPTSAAVGLSDQPLSIVPTPDNPSQVGLPLGFVSSVSYSNAVLHQNDPAPVLISAGRDISNLTIQVPKAADITAGRNIVSVSFGGQNLNPTDVTFIHAGGNLDYANPLDTGSFLTESGPGQFEIIAGGNIDLGATQGITSNGNITNGNLPVGGASISVLAGLGAPIGISATTNSADFVGKTIGSSPAYQSMLVDYVEQVTGDSGLSYTAASQIFRGFGLSEQIPLIDTVFFSELALSGQEANQTPSLGFGRGYSAIDTLFPGSRGSASPYLGDLSLGYSRIYTIQGGSISLLLPGGSINVGLVNPPTNSGVNRAPSQLGIVAVQAGDVNSYSLDSILVNESRLFTLGGGNITIWSTLGNIDAGNGAKSSISAPPPTISVDANGNVTLDFSAAVAGSGIRTIQSEPDVPAGSVSLMAPAGFVNAGDAGIGSAGNINIAAQQVIGATNINFGGTATGVPPEVSGVSASLSGASSVANSSSTAATSAVESTSTPSSATTPLATEALGWLDVFVEGFGEEQCKPDDIECLKRNRKTK